MKKGGVGEGDVGRKTESSCKHLRVTPGSVTADLGS